MIWSASSFVIAAPPVIGLSKGGRPGGRGRNSFAPVGGPVDNERQHIDVRLTVVAVEAAHRVLAVR